MDPTLQAIGAQAPQAATTADQAASAATADAAQQQVIETAAQQIFGNLLNLLMQADQD